MVMEFQSESFPPIAIHDCEAQMRELNKYSAPMPWIGMYIAMASLVCSSLMFVDFVYAIRWRKFWFPGKYFTLNAATFTFLGIAVKLSLDISSPMATNIERYAKHCNLLMMLVIMGNLSTSVGSMDGKSMVTNLISLTILAVTVFVNIIIQVKTELLSYERTQEVNMAIFCNIYMLELLIGFAARVPYIKVRTKVQYRRKYEMVSNEECLRERRLSSTRLQLVIKKLWILGVTSSPQFVFGRSIVCLVPFLILVLGTIAIYPLSLTTASGYKVGSIFPSSDYSWSIIWILIIQSIGIFFGFLSLLLRSIATVVRKINKPKNTTQIFNETIAWSRSPIQFQMACIKCKKLIYFFYPIKIIFIHLILLGRAIHLYISYTEKLVDYIIENSCVQRETEAEMGDFADYAIRLYPDEPRLSKMEINMIYYEQHQIIETGRRKQPKDLLQILQRSNTFIGLNNFDHIQVPSLHTKEPPSCWTLPVMTLARIAIAIPQEDNQSFDNIIRSVTEGLKFADLVDKSLQAKQELRNIRNAVKVMWLNVELDHKWLKVKPIMKTSREAKSSKEILEELAGIAKNRVVKFKESTEEARKMDHVDWSNEVVAANSMYRISSTLLLPYDEEEGNTETTAGADDGLLEKLLNMIADILSACLTNLPYAMTRECYGNKIEKMEDRVRKVAQLFGECEEILKLLESREVPQMDPEKALCIDEWQAFFRQGNAYDSTPIPNNVDASPSSEEQQEANAGPSQEEVHMATVMEDID